MKAIITYLGKKISVTLVKAESSLYLYICGKSIYLYDVNYFFACQIIDNIFPGSVDADPDVLVQAISEAGNKLIDTYNNLYNTNY